MIETQDVEMTLRGWGVGGQGDGAKLTLTFGWSFTLGDSSPLVQAMLDGIPELAQALELGHEDDARTSELKVSAARVDGGRRFTLIAYGAPGEHRTGLPKISDDDARLLRFVDCTVAGQIQCKITGAECEVAWKIRTPTEKCMVDLHEKAPRIELGMRTLARLTKTTMFVTMVPQEAPDDELTDGPDVLDEAAGVGRRQRRQLDLEHDAAEIAAECDASVDFAKTLTEDAGVQAVARRLGADGISVEIMAGDEKLAAASAALGGVQISSVRAKGDGSPDGHRVTLLTVGEDHHGPGAVIADAAGVDQVTARRWVKDCASGSTVVLAEGLEKHAADGLEHRLRKCGCTVSVVRVSAGGAAVTAELGDTAEEGIVAAVLFEEGTLREMEDDARASYYDLLSDDDLRALHLQITMKPTRAKRGIVIDRLEKHLTGLAHPAGAVH